MLLASRVACTSGPLACTLSARASIVCRLLVTNPTIDWFRFLNPYLSTSGGVLCKFGTFPQLESRDIHTCFLFAVWSCALRLRFLWLSSSRAYRYCTDQNPFDVPTRDAPFAGEALRPQKICVANASISLTIATADALRAARRIRARISCFSRREPELLSVCFTLPIG